MKKTSSITLGAFVFATMVSPVVLADNTMLADEGDSRPSMGPSSMTIEPAEMPDAKSLVVAPVEDVGKTAAEEEVETSQTKKEKVTDIAKGAAKEAAKGALKPLEDGEDIKGRAGKVAKGAAEAVADGVLDTVVKPFISSLIEGLLGPGEEAPEDAKAKSKAESDAIAENVTGALKYVGTEVIGAAYSWTKKTVSGWFAKAPAEEAAEEVQ